MRLKACVRLERSVQRKAPGLRTGEPRVAPGHRAALFEQDDIGHVTQCGKEHVARGEKAREDGAASRPPGEIDDRIGRLGGPRRQIHVGERDRSAIGYRVPLA